MIRSFLYIALAFSLAGCGDFHERMGGYPKADTTINLDTASPNEIADALSQLARIAVIGDDWEFTNPDDPCTVEVIDQSADRNYQLHLQGATFDLQRDANSNNYYAIMKHGDVVFAAHDGQALRLFETDSYHDVFFAEGYLLALAKKCQESAHSNLKPDAL